MAVSDIGRVGQRCLQPFTRGLGYLPQSELLVTDCTGKVGKAEIGFMRVSVPWRLFRFAQAGNFAIPNAKVGGLTPLSGAKYFI
jgi:hypothetical protein